MHSSLFTLAWHGMVWHGLAGAERVCPCVSELDREREGTPEHNPQHETGGHDSPCLHARTVRHYSAPHTHTKSKHTANTEHTRALAWRRAIQYSAAAVERPAHRAWVTRRGTLLLLLLLLLLVLCPLLSPPLPCSAVLTHSLTHRGRARSSCRQSPRNHSTAQTAA